jgi:acetyl-CoA C-acetyltransferase
MSHNRGRSAIVGVGEVPTGRFPDKGAIAFALESARAAILDAGIRKDEIDFVIQRAVLE